ncbi:DUF2911 domain-containing protein [Rhabdobacter roseus]|uniref:Tetratricopeptide (TPR) repeat protein n=1 Tax=Rhabdobacter roseus TaxID=1655419 RepID=A0A840TXN2_9BACT|nr:DUF2911 domain-containing protein [Rhabdobacter roseus]MBB5284958.1 tetratricopeptide (TPR) repeat protein [Rhabdobacter roseus]
MKNNFLQRSALGLFLAFSITLAQAQIQTPQPSPAATISQAVGLGKVTVEYSRPALKGRTMFGTQVPYGKVWRTGANKITNLILSDEMLVNGQKVAAGTYGLFTIPNQNEWTIILSKDANIWGAYTYKPENDVLRFNVKAQKLAKPEEYFTIEFTDFTASETAVAIRWENVQAKFSIKHDSEAKILAEIQEKTTASDANIGTLSAAANYYYDTNRDLKKAYEWATKVVEQDQKYWTYYLRGKIAAKIGQCDVAVADAQKGLKLAQEAGDDAYILNHQKLLKQCGK